MMKHILYKLSILALVFSMISAPVYAAPSKKSKAQQQREKLAQQKAKERAKAQAKKEKDKAKAQAQKDKEKAKRERDKERAVEKASIHTIHYLTMWGGGGYSGMLDNYKPWNYQLNNFANGSATDAQGTMTNKFIGGGGGMLGLGWEMHRKNFMFGLGPEFRMFTSIDKMQFSDPFNTDHASMLVWGKDYGAPNMIQHYNMPELTESQTVGQVTLPILVGGEFDKFYFLAGAKVGYTLIGNWSQRAKLNTSVSVPAAVEDWTDLIRRNQVTSELANHPLYKGTAKGKNAWGLDLMVSAEAGINLNEFFGDEWNAANEEKNHPWRFRLGAFVDYGIPLLSVSQNSPLVSAAADGLSTTSLHQSSVAQSKLGSLLVGVKFTALFQLNKPKLPNPMLQFFVSDTAALAFEDAGIPNASVQIRDMSQPKRKPRIRRMDRAGHLNVRMPKGQYELIGSAPGYLPSDYAGDTMLFNHAEDRNIAHIRLVPEPKLMVFVHNSETEQLITGAQLQFISQQNADDKRTISTPDASPAVTSLHYGDTYALVTSAAEYFGDTMHVSRLTDTLHIMLRPIHRVRHTLILKHMYFATDKSDILPESEPDLMILYNFLSENPRIRVLITGHTDNEGRDDYNQRLSENRSASVKAEMVKRGIDPNRIETDGKGESEPIDTNDTPEGRQNNRRVQVTVLNEMDAEEDIF